MNFPPQLHSTCDNFYQPLGAVGKKVRSSACLCRSANCKPLGLSCNLNKTAIKLFYFCFISVATTRPIEREPRRTILQFFSDAKVVSFVFVAVLTTTKMERLQNCFGFFTLVVVSECVVS